jgi:hypothetical protein
MVVLRRIIVYRSRYVQFGILVTSWEQLIPLFSTTLSSVGTTTASNLNLIGGKPISASITIGSSTSSGDATLQYTLQDLMRTSASAVIWQGVSSAIGAAATHFSASSIFPDGVFFPFQTPLGALRLSSTSVTGTWTLLVVEGDAW